MYMSFLFIIFFLSVIEILLCTLLLLPRMKPRERLSVHEKPERKQSWRP